MSAGCNIVSVVRTALGRSPRSREVRRPELETVRPYLPPGGSTYAERAALFARHAAALQAEFHTVPDLDAMSKLIEQMASTEGWNRVASHLGTLTDVACEAAGGAVLLTDGGYDKRELETCDVGITACDALIAQTGSVLLTCRSAGGRALSILPPHHVVLATREQLVADLADGFTLLERKYGPEYPSMMSFATGPSRTGDIERILVLGAHGPRRLTIILIEDDEKSATRT